MKKRRSTPGPVNVVIPGADRGVLDTLTASNQGLLIVLRDGRVILVELSLCAGRQVERARARGDLAEIVVTTPYKALQRVTVN